MIGNQCDFRWIPFVQRIFFNELLTTFKKAAAEHKVLDRLSSLDAGYQWESIIAIILSYNSLKYKPWFIFTKISGHTPLKNRKEFEYTQNLCEHKNNIFDGMLLYASKHRS